MLLRTQLLFSPLWNSWQGEGSCLLVQTYFLSRSFIYPLKANKPFICGSTASTIVKTNLNWGIFLGGNQHTLINSKLIFLHRLALIKNNKICGRAFKTHKESTHPVHRFFKRWASRTSSTTDKWYLCELPSKSWVTHFALPGDQTRICL